MTGLGFGSFPETKLKPERAEPNQDLDQTSLSLTGALTEERIRSGQLLLMGRGPGKMTEYRRVPTSRWFL